MTKLKISLGVLILLFVAQRVNSFEKYPDWSGKVRSKNPANYFQAITYNPDSKFDKIYQSSNRFPNPTEASVQIISEKFWNVPAPYIPPNDNILEDVSFSIGIILTVFVIGVISLGVIAGILSKPNSKRSLDNWSEEILNGISKFAELNLDSNE